jgi:hypothetical protein
MYVTDIIILERTYMALKNMRCVLFMRPNMSHGDVFICSYHVCRSCVVINMSRCPQRRRGVTDTPSVYLVIADGTCSMSIEVDVHVDLCTDGMSGVVPSLAVNRHQNTSSVVPSAAVNRRQEHTDTIVDLLRLYRKG